LQKRFIFVTLLATVIFCSGCSDDSYDKLYSYIPEESTMKVREISEDDWLMKICDFYQGVEDVQKKVLPNLDVASLSIEDDIGTVAYTLKETFKKPTTTEDMIAKIRARKKEKTTEVKSTSEVSTELKKVAMKEKKTSEIEQLISTTEKKEKTTEMKTTELKTEEKTTEEAKFLNVTQANKSSYYIFINDSKIGINISIPSDYFVFSEDFSFEISNDETYLNFTDSGISSLRDVEQKLCTFVPDSCTGTENALKTVQGKEIHYSQYFDGNSFYFKAFQDVGVGHFVEINIVSSDSKFPTELENSIAIK